ncbi:MAG: 2-oxoacid:ferredoxin oxidoreductase subunit beta [Porticoccaceae bacterium]|nr:2-oxoacid:ferredoxin oxidoreductase subunit beta [Porticoccaceae bacterium]
MSYIKPKFRHPDLPTNRIGLTEASYEGAISTLCAGCGHDSISAGIVRACWELDLPPHRVAKLSGIGCSSKSPTYFLNQAHGFNTVHGRMPSVATGANVANRDLTYFGVSGDGDSASIGMGQFAHVVRRNLNMVYVVENNGCYGLTKGQGSATQDQGSASRKGAPNPYSPIDLVGVALQLGATFVARSFSGDKEQLVPLIKAAIKHKGFALIDVVSPCVTFNNHPGSTKSYDYTRDHVETGVVMDFVPYQEEIKAKYEPGTTEEVILHDGSAIHLHKAESSYDPSDRLSAINKVQEYKDDGKILTGLIYLDPVAAEFHEMMDTSEMPFNQMGDTELCPGKECLNRINSSFQ